MTFVCVSRTSGKFIQSLEEGTQEDTEGESVRPSFVLMTEEGPGKTKGVGPSLFVLRTGPGLSVSAEALSSKTEPFPLERLKVMKRTFGDTCRKGIPLV